MDLSLVDEAIKDIKTLALILSSQRHRNDNRTKALEKLAERIQRVCEAYRHSVITQAGSSFSTAEKGVPSIQSDGKEDKNTPREPRDLVETRVGALESKREEQAAEGEVMFPMKGSLAADAAATTPPPTFETAPDDRIEKKETFVESESTKLENRAEMGSVHPPSLGNDEIS